MKIKFLGAVNLALFIGLLVAGLWPFRFRPENNVVWLTGESGVSLGEQGIIYSTSVFDIKNSSQFIPGEDSMSLEIWLQAV